ncbi:MAG: choice-of-anchor Q domain-containing protein, partial [Bacteroidota bacterium]
EFCSVQYAKRQDIYAGNIKGGAIFVRNYGGLVVRNSAFSNNMVICSTEGVDGAFGGAIYCHRVPYIVMDGNKFTLNRSFDSGGAVYIDDHCNTTFISNNRFIRNAAVWYKYSGGWLAIGGIGAAICVSDIAITNLKIFNNQCYNNRSLNGIIYTSINRALIYNNVICNNKGPGIMDGSMLSQSRIFNNTIVNNYSATGGIYLFANCYVYNNICWSNLEYPGQTTDQINIDPGEHPHLFNNCVQYGEGGDSAVYLDPQFVNPTTGIGLLYNGSEGDWALTKQSPCVNAGTPDTTGFMIPGSDILGNPRIFGSRIEIGAYENQSVWTHADSYALPSQHIIVFPNPGHDFLCIDKSNEMITIELQDLCGKIILNKELPEGSRFVNTETIREGMYLYRIFDTHKRIIGYGKWIKN